MTPHALLFTLAAIGISITVYLLRTRAEQEKLVCVIGERCQEVLESKYNKIFGVPNEFPGLLFYCTIILFTAFVVIGVEPLLLWGKLTKIFIAVAALLSLYLIYLQWRVIKVWCFWCLMSAATVFLMEIIVLVSDFLIT